MVISDGVPGFLQDHTGIYGSRLRGSAAFRKWLPNSVVRPLTIFATVTARVWLSIGERTELGMLSPCFSVHQTVTRRFWGYEVTKTNSLLVHEVNSDGFRVAP